MAGELITVDGVAQAIAFLQNAPKDIVARAFLKALTAGIRVIYQALEANTPTSVKLFDEETFREFGVPGALKKALMYAIQLDAQFRGGAAELGFGSKQGHVALWLEYGHRMVTHKRQGKKQVGTVPAYPFMRPTAEAAADAAIEAFGDTLLEFMRTEYGA